MLEVFNLLQNEAECIRQIEIDMELGQFLSIGLLEIVLLRDWKQIKVIVDTMFFRQMLSIWAIISNSSK